MSGPGWITVNPSSAHPLRSRVTRARDLPLALLTVGALTFAGAVVERTPGAGATPAPSATEAAIPNATPLSASAATDARLG